MKDKTKNIIRNLFKWGSLTCFLVAVLVILIEAAIPSDISAGQSNDIANVVQDELNKNHDKETIKEIESFDINLSSSKGIYYVGETIKYSVSYTPIDTSYKNIKYEISDSSLLKVDTFKNEITFLKEGNPKIVFKSERKSELTKSFSFKVQNVLATSIKIDSAISTLNIGDSLTLSHTISPSNTTLKDVTFVSSNPEVISIDKNGTLKAIKAGSSAIKVYLLSNKNISDEINIKVNEKYVEEVNSIFVKNKELYNNQSKELYGEYASISANFNLSILAFNFDDKNLSITKSKIDKSKGRFYFNVKYINPSLKDSKTISIKVNYKELVTNFKLTILPQEKLTKDLVDTSKLKLDYKISIITSTYYPSIKNFVEEIEIDIPFVQDVTKNQTKYELNNYLIETNNNLSIISSSYNKIKLSLSDTSLESEKFKYFFNKDDKESYLTFNLYFTKVLSDDHIIDIKLNKFYEDKELILLPKETYSNIFDKTIKSSSINSPLNKTPINVTLDSSSEDIVDIIYDKNKNPISLKTLKPGVAKLIVTSTLEDSVNVLNKVEKIYSIKVDNFITSTHLIFDHSELKESTITIDKVKSHELDFISKRVTYFADGTSKKHSDYEIPYGVLIKGNEYFTFDKNSKEIKGVKNGEGLLTFVPVDKKYKDFSTSLKIVVNHVEVDLDSFQFSFSQISSDKYNKPSKDFSSVPLNLSFKVSSIVNDDATNKNVRYISSSPSVIKINQTNGEAKALKIGKSTITCYSEDNPNIKITKTIDVIGTSSPFTIDKETLQPNKYEEKKDKNNKFSHYYVGLNFGESYKLKINPIDKNATSSKVKYTFETNKGKESNSNIISIDKEGNIQTKNIGSTWLKISYGDNALNTYSSYINIDVYRQNQMPFKDMAYKLRKLVGHFGLFAATATSGLVFIFLQFKGYKLKSFVMVIYTALGVFIAFLSEWVQALAPGRGCTIEDALLNSFGFLVVTLSVLALLIILLTFEKINEAKKERAFLEAINRKNR